MDEALQSGFGWGDPRRENIEVFATGVETRGESCTAVPVDIVRLA